MLGSSGKIRLGGKIRPSQSKKIDWFVISKILGGILYLADIYSDLFLFFQYWSDGELVWAFCTIIFAVATAVGIWYSMLTTLFSPKPLENLPIYHDQDRCLSWTLTGLGL